MKICVIISAYNGERYIEAQLDSIAAQSVDKDVTIYIRNDGSTDNTLSKLHDYAKKHSEVRLVIDNAANVGASKSFLLATRECPDADIYAYSDQDDIWEEGKLDAAMKALDNKSTPVLWVSDYTVVDSELNTIMEKGMGEPCRDQLKALFYGHVPGCVMVFNRALMQEMRKIRISEIRMHDVMALNTALITGELIYDDRSFIKYRQHDSNVLGYGHKKIRPLKWIRDKAGLIINKEPYDTSTYACEILRIWGDSLDDGTRDEYRLLSQYRRSFIKRIILLTRPYTKFTIGRTRLSIRCKILFGLM